MAHVDTIARAIDWLDACKSNDWRSVAELYAPDATASFPGTAPRAPTLALEGIEALKAYWQKAFTGEQRALFELVELYPGQDSTILIYYDEKCQRVSEFLQFNAAGLIRLSARHVIPQRRHVLPVKSPLDLRDKAAKERAILTCEARQSLGEARRLPIGTIRNALRQRAVALRALARRGDQMCG